MDLQNAIFEAFFAVYSELVRVDKANGTYDEGLVGGAVVAKRRRIPKELLSCL